MALKEDFDRIASSPKVDFVPEFVHSLQTGSNSPEGLPQMIVDINDIKCMLTVGIPNRVEGPFYDAYCDAYMSAYGTTPPGTTNPHVENIARDGAYTFEVEVNQSEDENDNGSSS